MAEQNSPFYVMGIDFGSLTAKTVILDQDRKIISACVVQKGMVSEEGVAASMAKCLEQAGLAREDITRAVSTGYGRRKLPIANRVVTEITCHAKGAKFMFPECRTIIDIGGQDSKVIAVDNAGLVAKFIMNDRCAAGTGQFLEVLARALGIDLDEMGPLALQAKNLLNISSMCTVFAETEVVSLLAEGHDKADIIGSVCDAIARRTVGLVQKVGLRTPLVMAGGVAKNIGVVKALERSLKIPIERAEEPQITGALGAALFAWEDAKWGDKE